MTHNATILFILAVIAYCLATTAFLVELRRKDSGEATGVWAVRALLTGAVFQLGNVVVASFVLQTCPVSSVPFALNVAGLALSGMYLAVRSRARIHGLGAAVAPATLVLLVASQLVVEATSPRVSGSILALHVTVNLLGVGFFLLAGIAGVVYLLLDRRLRAKRWVRSTSKLPSLDALDQAEYRLLAAGFALLTLGMLMAFALPGPFRSAPIDQVRALLGYLTWGVMGGVLLLRFFAGWTGRRAAYGTLLSVAGVVAIIAIYVANAATGGSS